MPSASGKSGADDRITRAQDRFIATWGQTAGAWGISRTMGEVFALLYISGESLNTDDVMARLEISRGNASMSLRALQEWGIVSRVHKRGDRKEYFEAERDIWTMFRTIARERKKRELDPVLASLYEIRDMTGGAQRAPSASEGASRTRSRNGSSREGSNDGDRLARHNERLDAMLQFMDTIERLSEVITSPEGEGLRLATKLLGSGQDKG